MHGCALIGTNVRGAQTLSVIDRSEEGPHPVEPDSAATTVDLRGQRVGNSYILVTPVGEGATG